MNKHLKTVAIRRGCLVAMSAVVLSLFNATAAIPSPEKLLPDDTLVVLTMPDFARVREIYKTSPQTDLWNDPAMKPFRDKFTSKVKTQIVEPLERELGIRLEDYAALPQGQVTLALTQNGWGENETALPGFLLLLDARDKSTQLKTNLADLRKKWVDSGKTIKTEKVGDIEFSVLSISPNDLPKSLKKVFGSEDEEEAADEPAQNKAKTEIIFGQYESLLIIGNSLKPIEKVAVRLTGGAMPALGDLAAYESSRAAMFRDAPFFGWVNAKAFVDVLTKKLGGQSETENMFGINPAKLISALGLNGLKSIAFNTQYSPEGVSGQFALGIPESSRQGLFKLFPAENKDSSPPPFVPADAAKFQRWRIDGQKAWATLEKIAGDISPQFSSGLNLMLETANSAAKDKDPSFDIRKNLFGNLGDDMINYEKAPQGTKIEQIAAAPSLFLIGSPRPEQLAAAVKSLLVLVGQGKVPMEREFLGRRIYSATLPAQMGLSGDAAGAENKLNYAASGSYLAVTMDADMLEQYLRNTDGQQKALRDAPGLAAAISKVGGSNAGMFGYENQADTTRAVLEMLRASASDNGETMLAPGIPAFNPGGMFKEWVDFSLLPPFEKISKYFHFSVFAGSANVDGLTLKMFAPVPPALRK